MDRTRRTILAALAVLVLADALETWVWHSRHPQYIDAGFASAQFLAVFGAYWQVPYSFLEYVEFAGIFLFMSRLFRWAEFPARTERYLKWIAAAPSLGIVGFVVFGHNLVLLLGVVT